MPEWFEALNGDFRYQLTAIGRPAPGLHIAEEISAHSFRIAGGEAGMKVSWQITGTRRDRWAVANPFEVEQEKPEEERGRFLEPSLYDAQEGQRIVAGPVTETLRAASASRRDEEAMEDLRRRIEEERRSPQAGRIDPGLIDTTSRLVDVRHRRIEELRRRVEEQQQEPPEST
jgi:hypothetical protein